LIIFFSLGEERLENGKKIVSKYLQKLNTTKQTLKHKVSSIKEKSSISIGNIQEDILYNKLFLNVLNCVY
jgi:hypothetical protein